MQNLDFLPIAYRQQQTRRAWFSHRVLVTTAFMGLLVAAASGQLYRRMQAQATLAMLTPQCEQAQRASARLGTLQAQLQTADAAADLQTYLRHPWPRSRLLAAVVGVLPKEIRFQEVRIGRDTAAAETPDRTARPDRTAQEQPPAKPVPAVADLNWLRETCDRSRTTIRLVGHTTDITALYQYLDQLAHNGLFTKADLVSLTQQPEGGTQFQVLVLVRPGYGQPGGPTLETKALAAASTVPVAKPAELQP